MQIGALPAYSLHFGRKRPPRFPRPATFSGLSPSSSLIQQELPPFTLAGIVRYRGTGIGVQLASAILAARRPTIALTTSPLGTASLRRGQHRHRRPSRTHREPFGEALVVEQDSGMLGFASLRKDFATFPAASKVAVASSIVIGFRTRTSARFAGRFVGTAVLWPKPR
jgi:hypothetical protein